MPTNLTTYKNGPLSRETQPAKSEQEEIDQLNRSITRNEIEYVIKTLPTNKIPRTRWLHRRILQNIQRGTYTHPP